MSGAAPLTPEERELQRQLDAAAGPGPSLATEARILAAARAAAAGVHGEDAGIDAASPDGDAGPAAAAQLAPARARGGRRPRRRWTAPLGLAASLALAFGVAWQLREPPVPGQPLAAPPSPATVERAAEAPPADAGAGAGKGTPVAEPAPASGPRPAAAPVSPPRSRLPAAPPAGPSTGDPYPAPAASRTPAAPPAPARVPAVPPPPPPPPAAPAPAHSATPLPAAAPELPAPPAPPAPVAAPAPPATDAHAPAPAYADDAVRAAAAAAARQAGDEARLQAERARRQALPRQARALAPPADEPVEDAQRWLQQIRERQAGGDLEAARASLRRFVRRYPQEAVPDDLRPLLDGGR